ncbi:M28 family metallopeptidase [Dokdonella sp.]|uniref:M28 family metallopeptidase n=1 Tax=Dokdonella sp. TaxID=2291710 RepID=UPI003784930A
MPVSPRAALILVSTVALASCQTHEISVAGTRTSPSTTNPVVPTEEGRLSPAITAADFAARLRRISSDEFDGRKPGTAGEHATTAWIQAQFESIGLKPGNAGHWLQAVPMVEASVIDADALELRVAASGAEQRYAYRKDIIVGALAANPTVDIAGSDIVFAGYGVDAPDYRWNDYADIDVRGKTVIVLANDPGWGNHDQTLFKGRALTYYGRWTYKLEEAARKGAAACLIVHDTDAAGYPWSVVVNSWSGGQQSLPVEEDPEPRVAAGGWITSDAARRLFAQAGVDFDALKQSADLRGFHSRPLAAKLSLAFHSRITRSSSDNVLGLLPGSTHPDEVVVYSAHWDHFGRDPALPGHQIYNGAIDNGTGVAALLEIAEAFARQQPPPQRSVLFLADTLEEASLLGSRYYVAHPAFPLARTIADINIDALPIMGPTHDIAVISWGQSDLDEWIRRAAADQGRNVVPDDAADKGFFFRSDQLNFARHGVPVLYARSGLNLVNGGEEAGRRAYADYTEHRYHKPGDVYDPQWDFRGVVDDVNAFYAVGRQLAADAPFPQWKTGADFHRPRQRAVEGQPEPHSP